MYRPGDHLVICDICGHMLYKSEARKSGYYTGMIVHRHCWDPKEIFPKVPVDKQSVKDARPDIDSEVTTTSLSASALIRATSVTLTSVTNVNVLTGIGIVLDSGEIQYTFATDEPTGYVVPLNDALKGAATSGNAAYIMSGDETTSQTHAERLAAL